MKTLLKTLLVAGACAASVACSSDKKNTTQTVVALPQVTTEVAKIEVVDQLRTFTGTVEANVTNKIIPQQARRILKIRFDVGDHVKAGQVIVDMENSSLAQAKAQLDNYKLELDRIKELYDFGGASKSELDGKQTTYDVALANYNNLVENTTLVSPVTGVVSARNYDNGDMYGNNTPILVIEQIRPVKIMINVSETLYSMVKKNMVVDVALDAFGDEVFKGKINRVYPTIDSATRTFPVEVLIANQDERVRPGMFARVTINYARLKNIVVADRAVVKQTGSGDRYVYAYNPADSTVSFNKVELGQRMGNRFEILSGIADGEIVVTTGQSQLKGGIKVEVVNQ